MDASCYLAPAGYTAPAAVHLGKDWSGFAQASFLYWSIQEEGLTAAQSAILSQGSLVLAHETKFIAPSFPYHPGLRVGVGVIYSEEWSLRAEYTWLAGSSSVSKSAPENLSNIPGLGVWNVSDWFQQTITFSHINSAQSQSLSATDLSSRWWFTLNLLDLSVERAGYLGANLILSPLVGVRTAWMTQDVKVSIFQAPASVGGGSYLGPQPISSRNRSTTFNIGPRLGVRSQYLMPFQLRIEALCAFSLLAMTSLTLTHEEDAQSIAIQPGPYSIRNPHYHGALPNLDLSVGWGWGRYFGQKARHIDFLASYDFCFFWGQNVIREMLDEAWGGVAGAAGGVTFQGLTVQMLCNF